MADLHRDIPFRTLPIPRCDASRICRKHKDGWCAFHPRLIQRGATQGRPDILDKVAFQTMSPWLIPEHALRRGHVESQGKCSPRRRGGTKSSSFVGDPLRGPAKLGNLLACQRRIHERSNGPASPDRLFETDRSPLPRSRKQIAVRRFFTVTASRHHHDQQPKYPQKTPVHCYLVFSSLGIWGNLSSTIFPSDTHALTRARKIAGDWHAQWIASGAPMTWWGSPQRSHLHPCLFSKDGSETNRDRCSRAPTNHGHGPLESDSKINGRFRRRRGVRPRRRCRR